MKMHLNFGSVEVPLMDETQDTDFGFTVEFDDGTRFEATFEAGEGEPVTVSIFDAEDKRQQSIHLWAKPEIQGRYITTP